MITKIGLYRLLGDLADLGQLKGRVTKLLHIGAGAGGNVLAQIAAGGFGAVGVVFGSQLLKGGGAVIQAGDQILGLGQGSVPFSLIGGVFHVQQNVGKLVGVIIGGGGVVNSGHLIVGQRQIAVDVFIQRVSQQLILQDPLDVRIGHFILGQPFLPVCVAAEVGFFLAQSVSHRSLVNGQAGVSGQAFHHGDLGHNIHALFLDHAHVVSAAFRVGHVNAVAGQVIFAVIDVIIQHALRNFHIVYHHGCRFALAAAAKGQQNQHQQQG